MPRSCSQQNTRNSPSKSASPIATIPSVGRSRTVSDASIPILHAHAKRTDESTEKECAKACRNHCASRKGYVEFDANTAELRRLGWGRRFAPLTAGGARAGSRRSPLFRLLVFDAVAAVGLGPIQ